MSQLAERIAQFRKMATDDPDNELGHFRLGQLLMEDNQHAEAIASFARTLELSPHFSKVYQLLAECHIKLERPAEAIKVLNQGWQVADERGDKMPRDAMGQLLRQLGEAAPQSRQPLGAAPGPGGDGFGCQRPGCSMGMHARRLPKPPMPDDLGARIQDSICVECWDYWFKNFSIKVINELHLDLSTEHGQSEYDRHLREFLGFNEPVTA